MQRQGRRRRAATGSSPVLNRAGPLVQPSDSAADAAPVTVAPKGVGRNRRRPVRYRPSEADDGEEFDINDHSDISEDTDPGRAGLRDPRSTAPAVANAVDTHIAVATNNSAGRGGPTIANPLATNRSTRNPAEDPLVTYTSTTSNKALDIEFFFRKETEDTICEVCE